MGLAPKGQIEMGGTTGESLFCVRRRLDVPGPAALWASLPARMAPFAWRGPDGVWCFGAGQLAGGQCEVGQSAAWRLLEESQMALAELSELAGHPWRAQVAVAFDPNHPGPMAPAARAVVPAWMARWQDGEAELWVMGSGSSRSAARLAAEGAMKQWLHTIPDGEMPLPLPQGRWALAEQEGLAWRERVQAAFRAIESGHFEKLVVSREARLLPGKGWSPFDALRAIAPSGHYLNLMPTGRPKSWWLMASPERLLEGRGSNIAVDALAGTIRRGDGLASDEALAKALRHDPKERAEHAWVVEGIRQALEPLTQSLFIPEQPELRLLPKVQHLFTPVRGQLKLGCSLLEAARALHPTPAVGGWPRGGVQSWLFANEAPRGWYAGALGWLESDALELAVGLRGGHWGPSGLMARAGGGLVAASQMDREWQETEEKLAAWQALLGAS